MKYSKASFISRTGFTLVEVLVVVTVIGILATIAFAGFNGSAGRGYDAAIISDAEALDSAAANISTKNSGKVSFVDNDGNGVDDGYHYDDTLINDPEMKTLNDGIGFKPTRGNVIDAKVTTDGTEYCIRIYNTRSSQYKTAATAFVQVSNKNVTSGVGTCIHT